MTRRTRQWLGVLTVLGALGAGWPSSGQTVPAKPADLAGTWAGSLKLQGVELRIVVRVKTEGQAVQATLASPDQSPTEFPIQNLAVQQGKVRFQVPMIQGSYEGTLDPAGSRTITGQWSQGPSKLPLTLKAVSEADAAGPEPPAALAGFWEGKLAVQPGIELRLVLRVETPNGQKRRVAFLDSPDQGANGIVISAIDLKGNRVTFEVKSIGGTYVGTLDPGSQEIIGEWSQGGRKFPLALKKTEKVSELRRPQHPQPPFPYDAEDVTYRNEEAGQTLAGTLTTPHGSGPFPAVLLITGSGAQDRDETIFGHKPFLVLADHLTRKGIAVLRVDDRGVGGSTGGSVSEATSADLAEDALAGVAFLKSHPKIDPKHIGLVGHSEGGLIAPIVATRSEDVAFIVLLAGTGLPGSDILVRQLELISVANGTSEDEARREAERTGALVKIVAAAPDPEHAIEALRSEVARLKEMLDEEGLQALGVKDGGEETLVKAFGSPWFHYFLSFDPRPTLSQVRCPVLALGGELDLQVPPRENLAEIEKAVRSGGNDRVTVREFPGLNHLFQHCKTGSPLEYGTIEETFSTEVLDVISGWIAEQAVGA